MPVGLPILVAAFGMLFGLAPQESATASTEKAE
jgi:hypothetical protein